MEKHSRLCYPVRSTALFPQLLLQHSLSCWLSHVGHQTSRYIKRKSEKMQGRRKKTEQFQYKSLILSSRCAVARKLRLLMSRCRTAGRNYRKCKTVRICMLSRNRADRVQIVQAMCSINSQLYALRPAQDALAVQ